MNAHLRTHPHTWLSKWIKKEGGENWVGARGSERGKKGEIRRRRGSEEGGRRSEGGGEGGGEGKEGEEEEDS